MSPNSRLLVLKKIGISYLQWLSEIYNDLNDLQIRFSKSIATTLYLVLHEWLDILTFSLKKSFQEYSLLGNAQWKNQLNHFSSDFNSFTTLTGQVFNF